MDAQLTLTGRLGRDPESKNTQGGSSMTSFSIAIDMGWGDNKRTEWVKVTAFGRTGENCAKFLRKGSPVIVHANKFEVYAYTSRQDGSAKAGLQVTADRVTFLSVDGQQQQYQQPQQQQYQQQPPQQQGPPQWNGQIDPPDGPEPF